MRIAAVTIAAVAALYAASGTYVVGPDEAGVLTRFGRLVTDDVAPGVHYHAPWPFERVATPGLRVVETAAALESSRGGDRGPAARRRIEFLTGDRCLVESGVSVEYEVTSPAEMVLAAADPTLLVRRVAESALAGAVARATIGDVLGAGAARIEREAAAEVQAVLDACRAGIRVEAVGLDVPRQHELANSNYSAWLNCYRLQVKFPQYRIGRNTHHLMPRRMAYAGSWRTVRVFVSSTFRDMHAERNWLARVVFPELRERCAKRELYLTDVDLRWGVTEEEANRARCWPFAWRR